MLQSSNCSRRGKGLIRFVVFSFFFSIIGLPLKPEVNKKDDTKQNGKYPHLPVSVRSMIGPLKLLHKAKSRAEIMCWAEKGYPSPLCLELSIPPRTDTPASHEPDLHGWIVMGTIGSGITRYVAYVFIVNPLFDQPITNQNLNERAWEMVYAGDTPIRYRTGKEIAFAYIDEVKSRLIFANKKAEVVGSIDFAYEINILRKWQIESGKRSIKERKEHEDKFLK